MMLLFWFFNRDGQPSDSWVMHRIVAGKGHAEKLNVLIFFLL